MKTFRGVLSQCSEHELRAVYEALAQWVDNERCNDMVEDPYAENPYLAPAEVVMERLDGVISQLAEDPT